MGLLEVEADGKKSPASAKTSRPGGTRCDGSPAEGAGEGGRKTDSGTLRAAGKSFVIEKKLRNVRYHIFKNDWERAVGESIFVGADSSFTERSESTRAKWRWGQACQVVTIVGETKGGWRKLGEFPYG